MKRRALLIISVWMAAGCGSTPPVVPSGGTDAATPALVSPSAVPSTAATASSTATLVVQSRLPSMPVIGLAPATDGRAWFIGRGSPGEVGLLSPSGVVKRAPAGPAPVAVAAADGGVFVVEGRPDTGPANQARSDVLERLDPETMKVVATVRLPELVTAITAVPGSVWAIATDGTVTAYDAKTLAVVFTAHLAGAGAGSIASTGDNVWAAIGRVTDAGVGQYAVARFDAASRERTDMVVSGDGVSPLVVAAGGRAWLAYADGDVVDRLAVSDGGDFVPIGQVAAPAGMVVIGETLWSAAIDGTVQMIDASSGVVLAVHPAAEGGGTAITSAGLVFVGLGDDVLVFPAG
jgi:hypothetical protein